MSRRPSTFVVAHSSPPTLPDPTPRAWRSRVLFLVKVIALAAAIAAVAVLLDQLLDRNLGPTLLEAGFDWTR